MSTLRAEKFTKYQVGFTTILNPVVEDKSISFKALGVLVYLLSRPDHWRPNYRQLMTTHTDGEKSVRAALRELEAAGYYARKRVKHEDGSFGWLTMVSDRPMPPGLDFPCLGEPCLPNAGMPEVGSSQDSEVRTEESSEEEAYASPSSRPSSSRPKSPIWDALADHFGPACTAPERRRRGMTLRELKEVGATPEQIEAAVKRHRRIWPKVTCTERSIVAHWTELTKVDPVDAERAAHNARMKKAREENGRD